MSLLLPRERQLFLHCLKKGPQCADRDELLQVTKQLYAAVTHRDLTAECNKHMADFRRREAHGSISYTNTFFY